MDLLRELEKKHVVILGAGPTGLGAAHRLREIGCGNYQVYERGASAGGLSASFADEAGFTWDIGGHVLFSHYDYFDRLMDDLLPGRWLEHERESWIRIRGRFVPYPLQLNLRHLPREEMLACVEGLIDAERAVNGGRPRNFGEWIIARFGRGLADIFLLPYNYKVWAYAADQMSYEWVGERVSTVDLRRVIRNILEERDDISWGPNSRFRFPAQGGTGEIWRQLAARMEQGHIHFCKEAIRVDSEGRQVHFSDGTKTTYDILISTLPLDTLLAISDLPDQAANAGQFRFSTTHVAGIGLRGQPPEHLNTKCWIYFPEEDCPFYRATVFSNYSPNNVPDVSKHWSLMLEMSESDEKAIDRERLADSVIQGLLKSKLIESPGDICSIWLHTARHGYPTPFLGRDECVHAAMEALESRSIYSRGRFGAWKYEVGNQDHSLMQGVEVTNRLAFGTAEFTMRFPSVANGSRRVG